MISTSGKTSNFYITTQFNEWPSFSKFSLVNTSSKATDWTINLALIHNICNNRLMFSKAILVSHVNVWHSGHLKLIYPALTAPRAKTTTQCVNYWDAPFIKAGICWPLPAISWSLLLSKPWNTRHQTGWLVIGGIKDSLLIPKKLSTKMMARGCG